MLKIQNTFMDEKSTRILWKERASLTEGEPIRRVSSTYYWWVEGGLRGRDLNQVCFHNKVFSFNGFNKLQVELVLVGRSIYNYKHT